MAKQALIVAVLLEVLARHGVMLTLSLLAAGLAALKGSPVWLESRRMIWDVLKSRQPKQLWRQVLLLVLSADAVIQQPGVALAVLAVIALRWLPVTQLGLGTLQCLGSLARVGPSPRRKDLEKLMLLVLCLEAFGRLSRWLILLGFVAAGLLAVHRSWPSLLRKRMAMALQAPLASAETGRLALAWEAFVSSLQKVVACVRRSIDSLSTLGLVHGHWIIENVAALVSATLRAGSALGQKGLRLVRKAVTLICATQQLLKRSGPKLSSLVESSVALCEGTATPNPSTGIARRRRDNTPEPPAERAAEHLARETRDAVKVKCAQAARKRWKEMKEHTPSERFQKAMKPSKGSRFAFAFEESRQMLNAER